MSSQFTIYSSSDASGPGLLTGQAGTLLTLLDACLVNGYTGKTAAGWSKPVANSGNIGSYKQGAGALLSLVINDNGPGAGTYKEARISGWEVVTGVASGVGSGSGQFPAGSYYFIRKSASADATGRSWFLAADSSTFYLWISTGDLGGVYGHSMYGDVFSMKGSSDAYRVALICRSSENVALSNGVSQDFTDTMNWPGTAASTGLTEALPGHCMARSFGGTGTSISIGKKGDIGAVNGYHADYSPVCSLLSGAIQTPNGSDNTLYLSPIWIVESGSKALRGRLRGLYQICHPAESFADGQTFQGAGDYAGKSFMVVRLGPNSGLTASYGSGATAWALETSATVETN